MRAPTVRAARRSHGGHRLLRQLGARDPPESEDDRYDRDERQRLLEKQVGQGKAVILVEDRKRQWDRRVVTEQLRWPRFPRPVEVANMKRGDREDCERDHPGCSTRVGLTPCCEYEPWRKHEENPCQQEQRRGVRHDEASRGSGQLQAACERSAPIAELRQRARDRAVGSSLV